MFQLADSTYGAIRNRMRVSGCSYYLLEPVFDVRVFVEFLVDLNRLIVW